MSNVVPKLGEIVLYNTGTEIIVGIVICAYRDGYANLITWSSMGEAVVVKNVKSGAIQNCPERWRWWPQKMVEQLSTARLSVET